MLWLSTRTTKGTYRVCNTSRKLHRHCRLYSCPLCFLQWFLDRALWIGPLHYEAKVMAEPVMSTLVILLFNRSSSCPDRPCCYIQTLRLSQCLLQCFTLLLTFWLPPCFVCLAKHFISKKSLASALTFPFAETEQSFTNHTTECKISKLFDIAGLMKWLALLCCNYRKRSVP